MPARTHLSCAYILPISLCVVLLFFSLAPSQARPQAQEPKPPVSSTLTPEQVTELEALKRQYREAYDKADFKSAESLGQQGLQKATVLKDADWSAYFLHRLGNAYYFLGQNDKAIDFYTRALVLYEKTGNSKDTADVLSNLGTIYRGLRQNDKALDFYTRTLILREKLGNPKDTADTLNNIGVVYDSLGQNDKALDFYTRALTLREKLGTPSETAGTLNNIGVVYDSLGQNDKAIDFYTRALVLYKKTGNYKDTADVLNNLGMIYRGLGQTDKVIDFFTRAFALYEKAGNPKDTADTLDNLGIVYSDVGQYYKALDCYTRALTLREKLGNPYDTAQTLHNLGTVYLNLGQTDKALDFFTRALVLYEKTGNPYDTADTLNNLGVVYDSLGQNDKAIDFYTRALVLYEKTGNSKDTAGTLNNLGGIYDFLGQNDKALDFFTRAFALYEKTGNPKDTADTLHNLGVVYRKLGQNDKAIDFCIRALTLREKLGNPKDTADTLNNLGIVYMNLGQNDKALDFFTRAFALYEKAGNPYDTAGTLNNLGTVYYFLGQADKALDFYTRALTLQEKLGNPSDTALTLNNLGTVYLNLGQTDKALDFFTHALTLREKLGNPYDTAQTLHNLGTVYLNLGQTDKALDFFTRALVLYEKTGNPYDTAGTLNNLGTVYYFLGQADKALDFYRRALTLKERLGNPQDTADTLYNLGSLYSDLGQLEMAEASFATARKLREGVFYQIRDPSEVGAFQATFGLFYESYAQLLLKRQRPEDAFEILEAGRGNGLARQIDLNRRGDLTRLFTAEERRILQDRTDALNHALFLQRHALQKAESASEASRGALQQQAASAQETARVAEQEYDLFRDSLFARYPDLKRVATGQPALFSELRALARDHPDTLYLEWGIVNKTTTLLFALGDRDGLRPFTLAVGQKTLEVLAQQWRAQVEIAGGRGAQSADADPPAQVTAKAAIEEQRLAQQAYSALLGDAEKAGLLAPGRYRRLVLVGSGPLLEMPLAALCDPQGKRLIERYPVSSALSLSVFFWRANPARPTHSLLCIADPTGTKEQSKPAGTPSGTGGNTAATSKTTQSQPLTSTGKKTSGMHTTVAARTGPRHSAFRAGFAPLPGARAEGRTVAQLFAGSRLLVGPEAKEATVLQLLPDYALLHFATHGYIVPKSIQSSGLVLAEETGEDRPDSPYDGLLTVRKIMNLPLSARLAVLSACETGRGVSQSGEGLMGLAWAFRAAGCPSLVASQWAVNDEATRQWMLAFYGALKAGKAKDVAAQAAMLAVKKQPDHRSPYYWAAFQVIGDTSPLP